MTNTQIQHKKHKFTLNNYYLVYSSIKHSKNFKICHNKYMTLNWVRTNFLRQKIGRWLKFFVLYFKATRFNMHFYNEL